MFFSPFFFNYSALWIQHTIPLKFKFISICVTVLISKVLTLWFSLNYSSSTTEVWLYSSALCLHFLSLLSSLFFPLSWVSYKEKALIVTTDRCRWACQPADLGSFFVVTLNQTISRDFRNEQWTMLSFNRVNLWLCQPKHKLPRGSKARSVSKLSTPT